MSGRRVRIAGVNDLDDGHMKIFEADGRKILLSRIDGRFYATVSSCAHYSAPLDKGILSGDRIVCPWHHACFNAKDGSLVEPPAFNALASYEVIREGEDVFVILPEDTPEHPFPKLTKADPAKDSRHFVIIGAGAAGYMAAQTLREEGFEGRISLITHENRLPYDRPNLSKDYLQDSAEESWMPLRTEDFFREYGIEVLLNHHVRQIDREENRIVFSDGVDMGYDSLLIAGGGIPRKLNIPGSELQNIFALHVFEQADQIIEACSKSEKVAVLGAGFIGMEAAFSLTRLHKHVTVIAPGAVPFENQFGREIGELFRQKHEAAGVVFRMGRQVAGFEGNGKVRAVVLDDGTGIETDLVVAGIGIKPNNEFLAGFKLEADGSIPVDENFHVEKNIYAAGDLARFPYWYNGEKVRIEHWRSAQQMGRCAARNMLGIKTPFRGVPFFWTSQVGLQFRYIGYVRNWDEIIVDGNISRASFIAYYIKENKIQAAAGIKYDREIAALEELMRLDKMPSLEQLRSKSVDLLKLL